MANIVRAASRRDVLKIGGLASAGALLGGRHAQAATGLSFMHESSFIQTYDDFFKKTLESVRDHAVALPSLRTMSRIDASNTYARAFRFRHSQSFARRRQRLSHAKVRSTTQRFGRTTKPFA